MFKGSKKYWFLAVLCGLATAFFSYQYLQDLKTRYSPDNLMPVLMASETINKDSIISTKQLTVDYIPAQYVHPQALPDKKGAAGKTAIVEIMAGEQILESKLLSESNRKQQLAYNIPKDCRAVSIAINSISGVAGYITPGDYVDVIATMDIEDAGSKENSKPYSILTLQEIKVLAVGENIELGDKKSAGTGKTITLAVSINDALPLVLASERGNLRLLLRSPVDESKVNLPPYQPGNLLEIHSQP